MSKIPLSTISRLSFYYRVLSSSELLEFISSEKLAGLTGFSADLIRRDLNYFGQFGIPRKGYPAGKLKEKIANILGINRARKVALIGIGDLGSALLKYKGFKTHGFEIVAVFDNDPKKIGTVRENIKIQDVNQLKRVVEKEQIKMAIITVPDESAQEVVDKVVGSKIKAILNFAPIKVKVHDSVNLLNIDMSVELEKLSYLTINNE